jgi:hypothetical protein
MRNNKISHPLIHLKGLFTALAFNAIILLAKKTYYKRRATIQGLAKE